MILSKRETYIAIGTGSVLVLMLFYVFAIKPYFERRDDIAAELETVTADLGKLQLLFQQQQKLRKVWDEMNAGGLSRTPSEAESLLQDSLEDWAQESGVDVTTLRPLHTTIEGKFLQTSFKFVGTGPLSTVSNLLWRIETTTMPLRVGDIQIIPRKEGDDDLQFTLDVSTLCRAPAGSEKPLKSRQARATSNARGESL